MSHETIIVYFGCWDDSGHYSWLPNKQRVSERESWKMMIPKADELDGSRLFLPRPERPGVGSMTYLPAPNRTVLAWWGNNPWDSRGRVNQAIITNGELGMIAMWQRFVRYFPTLAEKLEQPVIGKKL